jgi:hypothetical protein
MLYKIVYLFPLLLISIIGKSQVFTCCYDRKAINSSNVDSCATLIRSSGGGFKVHEVNGKQYKMMPPLDYEYVTMGTNYFYVELSEPLVADKEYSISLLMKISASEVGMPMLPGYSLSFGQDKFSQDTSFKFGQIIPLEIEKLDSTWQNLSVKYQANGKEKCLVVGLLPYFDYWSELDAYGRAMKAITRFDRTFFLGRKKTQIKRMRKSLFDFEKARSLSDEKVVEITRAIKLATPNSVNAHIGLMRVEIKPL